MPVVQAQGISRGMKFSPNFSFRDVINLFMLCGVTCFPFHMSGDIVSPGLKLISEHFTHVVQSPSSPLNLPRRARIEARRSRSFRRCQGKLTASQRRTMKEYWPVYGLNIVPNSNWDFNQVFKNIETNSESKGNSDSSPHRNVILDIGFGNGQSILSMSKSNPSTGFVGVEVYKPGICGTMKQLATLNGPLQQNNVKLVYGDVITVLADSVCERSLQKVLIFFPDPFPSHPNRRIVRPLLASLLASRIKIGGTLHIATDVEDYAVHVMSIMDSSTSKALGWTGGICKARPDWRPHTMYENIALSEGREIFDFCYYLGPSLN